MFVIRRTLTAILNKNVQFPWGNNCQSAFAKLEALLINEPILIMPHFTKQFFLAVVACDLGLGVILMQEKNGFKHPMLLFTN